MLAAARRTVMKLCRLDAMLAQIHHCDQANRASRLNQNGACFPAVTNALPVRHVSFRIKADQLFAFKLKYKYLSKFKTLKVQLCLKIVLLK